MAEDPTALPRTERPDAPLYLASYLRRRARAAAPEAGRRRTAEAEADAATPLYLRRFRERRADPDAPDAPPPVWNGEPLEVDQGLGRGHPDQGDRPRDRAPAPSGWPPRSTSSATARPRGTRPRAGLTPLGGWQAHRRGFDLSKGIRDGEQVRIVCADTNRARQTAEHLHRGLLDGLDLWRRDAKVAEPRPMAEFRNFQVATPDGLRDVTSAFRMYQRAGRALRAGRPRGPADAGWSRSTGSGTSSRAGPTRSTTG